MSAPRSCSRLDDRNSRVFRDVIRPGFDVAREQRFVGRFVEWSSWGEEPLGCASFSSTAAERTAGS